MFSDYPLWVKKRRHNDCLIATGQQNGNFSFKCLYYAKGLGQVSLPTPGEILY